MVRKQETYPDEFKHETVQVLLTMAFQRYGLSQAILMDNFPPWSAPHVFGA